MNQLTGRQKAAVLLITLGSDLAGKVLVNLRESEVERLTREVLAMEKVTEDVKQQVLDEVYELALARNVITPGGASFAKEMLEKGLGQDQATEIWSRLSSLHQNQRFRFLQEIEPGQLLNFIQNEHPQTIALLVSYLSPNLAASIISSLSPELQAEVSLRVATMDRTSPEILESLENLLKTKMASVITQEFSAAGGVDYLVRVLNNVDRATERRILEHLDQVDAQLAADVRKLMFTFDDLILLDDRSLQRLLREIDNRDLVLALKGTNEELRGRIFRNQSSRAAQMLKEELEVMGPVRIRNIEEAQQRIANIVRRLDEAEEIVIAGKGDDAFI